jgi:putative PIN family toxin of toxin-antitoxin system
VRAVLDVNVLVAALLSPSGAPAQIMALWLGGAFDLVVSTSLLTELERTLAYPKVRRHIDADSAAAFPSLLRQTAVVASDAIPGAHRSADPGDDYLLALAEHARAILVSGDRHVLDLAGGIPIETPRAFLNRLDVQ